VKSEISLEPPECGSADRIAGNPGIVANFTTHPVIAA